MIINAKELSSILTKCKKFASQQEFTPLALKCLKFQGDHIMAMDRHRGIVFELDNGYDFGEFLTAANLMDRVFSHIEGEAEIKVEGNHIKIEAGKFRTRIPLYQERYAFPDVDLKDSKSLPRNFFDAVKEVYFAVCKDTSKERCRGVFLDKNILYSTDTHRIAKYTTDFENDSSFIVPDELLEILLAEEDSPESYGIEGNKFWFFFKDHKAFALRVREPFPNCERIFNSLPKHGTYCTFEKSAMSSALKRMQPFCEGPQKRMDVKVKKGKIFFGCRNSNGEAEEEIECEGGGDWGPFSVSHDFFEACAIRMSQFQYHHGDFLYFQEGGLECLLKIL
jgi:DNA polymerase III sliding clamp (beta) subunit (PCNA family)